jgi:hypothetical protein
MTEHVIETRLARVSRPAADLVVVRFKENVKLDSRGIAEILQLRRSMGADGAHKVMIVMPEDVDFEMSMITTDHYREHNAQDHTLAVAWVAGTSTTQKMTSIHLSYFPPPFRSEVFASEEEALRWLDDPGLRSGLN